MIVVTGLSHHTAGIEVREQVAFTPEDEARLTVELLDAGLASEAFVISTCNRLEIVAFSTNDSDLAVSACSRACREAIVSRCPAAEDSLYSHRDQAAVRHLVRVASSLDSLVVGEAQILGQMKQGFERGRRLSTVGPAMHQLFARVARGAKRVRSETSIGVGQVSVPSIAIELAVQIFGELSGRRAILVGAGDMGQTVARLLADLGARVSVVGRNLQRVTTVAEKVGGTPHVLAELPELLVDAEVLVSSTSSPHPVVTGSQLSLRKKNRRAANLLCIDLAVPRDIDPALGKLDGTFLYDVDDLAQVAQQSAKSRQAEAGAAEEIVSQVVADWERHTQAQQVVPTIKALRAKMRLGLEAELERSLKGRLRHLNVDERAALAKMLDAGINRTLHGVVTRLRTEAARDNSTASDELAAMLAHLFELEDVAEEELDVPTVRVPNSAPTHEAPDPSRKSAPVHEALEPMSVPRLKNS